MKTRSEKFFTVVTTVSAIVFWVCIVAAVWVDSTETVAQVAITSLIVLVPSSVMSMEVSSK